jgi:LPXTG-motif cell wall-anchored protein
MIRKLMVVSAMLAGLFAVSTATPASAAPVDYAGCVVSLSPNILQAGDAVQVTGSGFQPGVSTNIVFDRFLPAQQTLGSVTPDAAGSFVATVTVPANASAGLHSITVNCSSSSAAGFATSILLVGSPGGGTTGGTAGGTTGGATTTAAPGNTLAQLFLSATVVQRLELFTATVTGARPGSTVEFAQLSTRVVVGTAVADVNGVAKLQMSFPANAELGDHQVEARGIDKDGDAFDLFKPIKVVAPKASGAFPTTGADSGPMALAGLGAVALGAVLVAMARRRKHATTTA